MPAASGWRWNMPSSKPSEVPIERLRLIADCYRRLAGKPLLDAVPDSNNEALRAALWNAPFAIVAHGTEADPIFFYGNQYALQHFEMDFDEFVRLPSKLSAEPMAQEGREKLLAEVMLHGYVAEYSGVRIAKSGNRFLITEATVWNLRDEKGSLLGQAARFVSSNR